VHALSKYVVEEAVKIVKMSVKEIVIENQVQPSRIKLNKEKIAIKGKTGEVVDIITTSENKIIIFGIPENVTRDFPTPIPNLRTLSELHSRTSVSISVISPTIVVII
jgi:hypothetical protein